MNTIDYEEPELFSSDKSNHSDDSFRAKSTPSESSIEQENLDQNLVSVSSRYSSSR